MIPALFLHGGGDVPVARVETFGRFARAATTAGVCRLALLIAADDEPEVVATLAAYRAIFGAVGVAPEDIIGLTVAPGAGLTEAALAAHRPTGVFVCGGLTPRYQAALCADRRWLDYLRDQAIPYGGTSAGAAIAADRAIVGGWRAWRGGVERQVVYEGAGEGLDRLEVRPGLGLVPFAVEVHASQWGTLTRLLHAVDLGLVEAGWAIDENTLLEVTAGRVAVHGLGHAYHARRAPPGGVVVQVFTAGVTMAEPMDGGR